MSKYLKFALILFISHLNFVCYSNAETTLRNSIQQNVLKYFQNRFDTPAENIHLKFLRLPNHSFPESNDYQIEVYSQRESKKLGYQTIWVEIINHSKLIKKFPVSVDISIEQDVVIAKGKIGRGKIVDSAMISVEKRIINQDWENVIMPGDQIIGLESRRVIKQGVILTKNLFRNPPAIKRGELIKVQVCAGNLIITTAGIARGEGSAGDKIKVESKPTGKKVIGTIQSPGLVVVRQEDIK